MPSPATTSHKRRPASGRTGARAFLHDNGLTVALVVAFLASLVLMLASGWIDLNTELAEHGRAPIGLWAFAVSGRFLSALLENWESEFLQMAAYVCLTAVLFQRGSAESRDPDAPEESGPSPLVRRARSPLRRVAAWLYSYSLGLVLALLFALSFLGHLTSSLRDARVDAALHGAELPSLAGHLADASFWFESFQNWQSEFLSTAVLVVLSIWLRFHGSPESKQVTAPASDTGSG